MRKMGRMLVAVLTMSVAMSTATGCALKAKDGSVQATQGEQAAAKNDGSGENSNGENSNGEDSSGRQVGVTRIVNGTIGDKSFNDLAYAGLRKAEEDFGIKGTLVENNYDTTKYEPSIIEFAEDPDCDLIIVNSADVKEIIEKVAPDYPDKRFVIYDSDIDYSAADLTNVYSTTFKQNEASFLAGALGARMTSLEGDDHVNPEKVIGFVAGGDNVIINDFLLGYIEGCEYGDPDARMLISYIGNFSDAAKGKEMGLSQVNQGADVIFQVAAGAGLGVLEGCKDSNVYAIGVDDDQYNLFKDTDQDQADVILTSVMKSVDNCVYSCIKRHVEGNLPYGTTEALGLKEGMVSIAKNENYEALVPEEIQEFMENLEKKIVNGEVVVGTNIGAEISVIEDAKDRIKP